MHIIKCDIEKKKLPFPDNSFDAVIFNELLENLRINTIFTLSEVLRVMKLYGVMMLSSPNLRSLNRIKNHSYSCSGDIYFEYQKIEKLGHMGHVREYTIAEVITLLEKVGFIPTDVIYRGQLNSMIGDAVSKFFPSLRPFVSYVSKKQ